MDRNTYDNYIKILRSELLVALGCTEPIAIALAAAKAKEVLGKMPERCEIHCSGNIIKNVKGVIVPNTGKLKGVNAAAIAGITGGNASKELEVLESMSLETIKQTKELMKTDFCKTFLITGESNLYIKAAVFSGNDSARVEINDAHTNIIEISYNGEIIFRKNEDKQTQVVDSDIKSILNIKDIVEFAKTVKLEDVEDILNRQIEAVLFAMEQKPHVLPRLHHLLMRQLWG